MTLEHAGRRSGRRTSGLTSRLMQAGLLSAALLLQPAAHALTVIGHTYAEAATVAGAPLKLNGAGVASKFGFNFYTAGLYLKDATRDAQAVMADAGPKRLRIRLNVGVAAEKFADALRDGVAKRASAAEQEKLAPRIERMNKQIKALGELKSGDAIDLDYLPGKGTLLSLNEQVRGTPVEGADLFAAVLEIYIGDQPLNPKLKAGLLGAAAP